MGIFHLKSDFSPAGEQPKAIEEIVKGIEAKQKHQTLLGVTGSGKTFVIANAISKFDLPVLVISHNKTLCAQLYGEFKNFFPDNAVEYFVSYYDYYQPEAYLPATDVYIEKDASINEKIDRLRLSATANLMLRKDVIVVASVSCIYGLGRPRDYAALVIELNVGMEISREELLRKLVDVQYIRNDIGFARGNIRVRGDAIEVWPSYQETVIRIELFGDEIDGIHEINYLTGEIINTFEELQVLPAKHFVMEAGTVENSISSIEAELEEQLKFLRKNNKLLEAQRLESRTEYDMELLKEIGYCQGVENYSRHFDGRKPGERPANLFDYFPDEFLLVIDESHVTVPQIRGMFNGDRSRKMNLVEHGFRLPSALDNRPIYFEEFKELQPSTIYVSATPADYEIELCNRKPVELVTRPTGLIDPPIEVRPAKGQVEDIQNEIKARAKNKERVLITTLTKKLAEDLDEYCRERGLRTMYMHSDIKALDRVEILKNLRLGKFDALIGVNLLREGLDLPEVSLVIVIDADKQGFLRSHTSLMQTIGRTARNVGGEVIFYADSISDAMQKTIEVVDERRAYQIDFNKKHNIIPQTVKRAIDTGLEGYFEDDIAAEDNPEYLSSKERALEIELLEKEMLSASKEMRFEDAAAIRDRLLTLNAPIDYTPANEVKALQKKYKRKKKGYRSKRK